MRYLRNALNVITFEFREPLDWVATRSRKLEIEWCGLVKRKVKSLTSDTCNFKWAISLSESMF